MISNSFKTPRSPMKLSKFFCSLLLLNWMMTSHVALADPAQSKSPASEAVAFETDRTVPLVNLAIASRRGAVDDPAGRSGLTNIVGEMLLRGTKFLSKEEFDSRIDSLGAQLEVEVRAEAVILRGAVLASKLDQFLALLEQAITQQVFEEKELKKLKTELLAGIAETRNRDSKLASEWFHNFLFQGHPYGNPILGRESDITNVTREDVRKHYGNVMNPAEIVLIGSGDADPEKLADWMSGLRSKLKSITTASKAKTLDSPVQSKGRRLLFVDKPDRSQTQVLIGQMGVTFQDPRFFALHAGNFIFGGGGFSSRLMKEIRVKRGWSYGAGSNFRFGTRPRSWGISLMPKTTDTAPALKEAIRLADELKTNGITDAEFKLARSSLVNGSAFMANTPEKRVENRILEVTLGLPAGFMGSWQSELRELDRRSIDQAMSSYMSPGDYSIVVLGTATPTLLKSLAEAAGLEEKDIKVVRYTQDVR